MDCEGCDEVLPAPAATGRPRRFHDDACRVRAHRRRAVQPRRPSTSGDVLSAPADNAALIRDVAALYLRRGDLVADVTWGKGGFWRGIDRRRFTLLGSDVHPRHGATVAADFRALPYRTGSVDVVVLDPPYIHNPGRHITDHRDGDTVDTRYNNAATTRGMDHAAIIELYRAGMAEAARVLRPGGLLWVKCKDEIEARRQRWSHLELHAAATDLGLTARDMFVVVPQGQAPRGRWNVQRHARKTHSYLWVFQTAGRS